MPSNWIQKGRQASARASFAGRGGSSRNRLNYSKFYKKNKLNYVF